MNYLTEKRANELKKRFFSSNDWVNAKVWSFADIADDLTLSLFQIDEVMRRHVAELINNSRISKSKKQKLISILNRACNSALAQVLQAQEIQDGEEVFYLYE